jgi:PadR family transcriptional regulator PadR
MNAQLKKGVLELCVLSRLSEKDMYGYELYQELNQILKISESTIYPILRKLVQGLLCTTYLKESNEGPPRKYFKLTNVGVAKLKLLITEWNGFKFAIDLTLKKGEKTYE